MEGCFLQWTFRVDVEDIAAVSFGLRVSCIRSSLINHAESFIWQAREYDIWLAASIPHVSSSSSWPREPWPPFSLSLLWQFTGTRTGTEDQLFYTESFYDKGAIVSDLKPDLKKKKDNSLSRIAFMCNSMIEPDISFYAPQCQMGIIEKSLTQVFYLYRDATLLHSAG